MIAVVNVGQDMCGSILSAQAVLLDQLCNLAPAAMGNLQRWHGQVPFGTQILDAEKSPLLILQFIKAAQSYDIARSICRSRIIDARKRWLVLRAHSATHANMHKCS